MITPMLFSTAKISGRNLAEEAEQFVTNDELAFEQKLDGARVLIQIDGQGHIDFFNRRADPMSHTASTQWFDRLRDDLQGVVGHLGPEGNCILDGELMHDTGTYYAFDLPEFDRGPGTIPRIRVSDSFRERRYALTELAGHFGPSVHRTRQALIEQDKRELVQRVIASEGEGVMVKHLAASYDAGRVKHSLKVKVVRSVDVVVTGVERPDPRHGSFEFGLYPPGDAPGEPIYLGSCSAIGKPNAQVGDVIEVHFLGWIPGGGLREPRMIRIRMDKAQTECTTDQLKAYSKAVL